MNLKDNNNNKIFNQDVNASAKEEEIRTSESLTEESVIMSVKILRKINFMSSNM